MNGYGRGSKKLGIPTANLPHFDENIKQSLLGGVYFGWGYLPTEGEMLGCVVNIGKAPTFVNQVSLHYQQVFLLSFHTIFISNFDTYVFQQIIFDIFLYYLLIFLFLGKFNKYCGSSFT